MSRVTRSFRMFLRLPENRYKVDFPDGLLRLRRDEQEMRISMVEASIPRTFYNINYKNNTINFSSGSIVIPDGNYDAYSLLDLLNALCKSFGITVTYNEYTNGYTFTAGLPTTITFARGTARLLGFDIGTLSLPATSIRPALLSYPLVLYLNSDIPQSHSVDNLKDSQKPTLTSCFGKVDVSVAPFDMVQYHEPSSVYSINVASRAIHNATFWVTADDGEDFPLLHPYSITLLVEFLQPNDELEDLKKSMRRATELLNLIWLKEPPSSYAQKLMQ